MTHSRKRLDVFLAFTKNLALLSKCEDKQTAAIIVDKSLSQVYSVGVNGGPKGGADCLCALHSSKYTCIHAECNAIAKCFSPDPKKTMICTYSPCVTCASLIANSGFDTVIFIEAYKDTTGLEILKTAGIDVFQASVIDGGMLLDPVCSNKH